MGLLHGRSGRVYSVPALIALLMLVSLLVLIVERVFFPPRMHTAPAPGEKYFDPNGDWFEVQQMLWQQMEMERRATNPQE